MKLPKDAVVEWRCGVCGGLCGYVRIVDGVRTFTPRRRAGMFLIGHADATPIRYAPGESVPDFHQPVDVPFDDDFLIAISTSSNPGVDVSCGRHDGRVVAADFRRARAGRRRVTVSPTRRSPGASHKDT